ncbi:unnamed protein product, partial [Ectocarpus sp. 4 AP-2014]
MGGEEQRVRGTFPLSRCCLETSSTPQRNTEPEAQRIYRGMGKCFPSVCMVAPRRLCACFIIAFALLVTLAL